jgi:hypothetical protein
MAGPEETRLIQALQGANPGKASGGAKDWSACAELLDSVAASLAVAQLPVGAGDAGEQTAKAITESFHRSAKAMSERAGKMRQGTTALQDASQVITTANEAHIALGPEPTAPTYTPHEDPSSEAGIKKHNAFLADQAAYDAEREHREKVSQREADRMDTVFAKSSATMKDIHGIPDPPPPPPGYGGTGGGSTPHAGTPHSPTRGDTGGTHPTGQWQPPRPPADTGTDTGVGDGIGTATGTGTGTDTGTAGGGGGPQGNPGIDYQPNPGSTPGPPVGTGTGIGGGLTPTTGLGVAGAAAGGIGGGLLGAGLTTGGIRGTTPVVTSPGTSASGVRGIGATARSGVSGTLGRSGGAAAVSSGSSARGTGARAGATAVGRGTSARGAAGRGADSRGAAGGRGGAAGSTAGGRSGRSKDEKKGRRDPFDVEEEWVDDEGAAPGVLD